MGCGSSNAAEVKYKDKQEKAAVALAEADSSANSRKGSGATSQASANNEAAQDKNTGRAELGDDADPAHVEKLQVVKEVYIFRHLGQHQLDLLVGGFTDHSFKKGEKVIAQGQVGDTFWVVRIGEVQVTIDGRHIRNMGKNAYFGERALLFDEPRSATVEVVSSTVECCSVDKSTFMQIVKGKMQQQLMHRIRMQDTSVEMSDLVVVRQIGEGAAGSVDLVQHKKTQTRYALKRVKKEHGKLPQEVEREIDLLKMNDHPFVLQLVKTFETEDLAYMLVELITGGELHAAIRTIPTVLSRTQAQFYVGSLALALEGLHTRRIVYRDLKPENVMLDHQGYLKIIDFGIAKKLDGTKAKTFTTVGTPHYMAPEVMRGKGYSFSVDDWSLGIILFELVVGYLPFANDLDSAQEVCLAVIQGKLEIPAWYKDQGGQELMSGLLCHDWRKRIGANGFQDLKNCKWFKRSSGPHYFDQLMGREIDAPVVPKGEVFASDEED